MTFYLATRVQDHAAELRAAWARQHRVALRLDTEPPNAVRLSGTIIHVSSTGAIVVVAADGYEEPVDVPCDVILSIRRPHFSEPLDAIPAARPVKEQAAGQLSFLEV